MTELSSTKNLLQLERNELLSTILLALVDTSEVKAEIICIGDGLVYCDAVLTEFDQENQPDYLAYHLGADFDSWYTTLDQRMSLANFSNLTLCTDGLLTFADSSNGSLKPAKMEEVIAYLLEGEVEIGNERYFQKRMRRIKQNWGIEPTDDLGIVQIRFTSSS